MRQNSVCEDAQKNDQINIDDEIYRRYSKSLKIEKKWSGVRGIQSSSDKKHEQPDIDIEKLAPSQFNADGNETLSMMNEMASEEPIAFKHRFY